MPANLRRWSAVGALILALGWFLVGINWGLPSRRADPFLFGPDRPPWTGKQILQLTGDSHADADRGADVDANPIVARDTPIVLNDTDPKHEIVRRYRLYSYQPDEMITFNALRQMNPAQGRLDPRLYQYGGLWVYPVGGMLKLASLLRLVELRADVAYYLDQPEAFARFYVVAHLYSAALWGSVGAWVVYRLVLHITTDGGPATAGRSRMFRRHASRCEHGSRSQAPPPRCSADAAGSYGGDELRAHGTEAVLDRRRHFLRACIWHGAVGLPVFIILPVMTLLRRRAGATGSWVRWPQR